MRFSSTLFLALPALAIAEQAQVPLADKVKGWLGKASSYVSQAAPAASGSAQAAAAKIAAQKVTNITQDNYKDVFKPSPAAKGKGPEEWMVFITGGNNTCWGMCENATKAWDVSVPILAALPNGPKLAVLDCETQGVLCNAWASGPPNIYHFLIPAPLADQSTPATTVRSIRLNRTTANTQEIVDLHTKKKYLDYEPYEGVFHPFDGLLTKLHLAIPLGYVIWAFAKMPSWLPMIAVSFLSRSFMGRRANPAGPAARPAGAAPAAPAAAR